MNQLERILLSKLIAEPGLYLEHSTEITDGLFLTDATSRDVFRLFVRAIHDAKTFDISYVASNTSLGLNVISEIWVANSYEFDFRNTLDALREQEQLNRLAILTTDLRARIQEKEPSIDILRTLADFTQGQTPTDAKILHVGTIFEDLIRHIRANAEGQGVTGVPTGIQWIDTFTGGLQRSDMVVLAGRTSQGKTSLALTMAYNAAVLHGKAVGFVSMEMSNVQLVSRLTAYATQFPSKRALFSKLTEHEIESYRQYAAGVIASSIYISDSHSTRTADVMNQIRLMRITRRIDMAVIDYLQLMSTGERGRSVEQDTADTTRRVKNLAKELDIPIVLISQLARQGHGESPRPTLGQLRNSGQIEEAADVVLFVYRPEFYGITDMEHRGATMDTAGRALLEIAKGRNVGTGSVVVDFDKELTYFTDFTQEQHRPSPLVMPGLTPLDDGTRLPYKD